MKYSIDEHYNQKSIANFIDKCSLTDLASDDEDKQKWKLIKKAEKEKAISTYAINKLQELTRIKL